MGDLAEIDTQWKIQKGDMFEVLVTLQGGGTVGDYMLEPRET